METIATIPHSIFAAAEKNPQKIAMRGEDGVAISYAELVRRARESAAALMAGGLERGDRVAIWAPNSPGWVIAALGVQVAGGILVTLNTRLKGPEAAYLLQKSGARLLFIVSTFLDIDFPAMLKTCRPESLKEIILIDGRDGGISWDEFIAGGRSIEGKAVEQRLAGLKPGDISDILFTSGTTGQPKGVCTSHGQNIRLYRQYTDKLSLGPDDTSLIVIPFFHSFGYKAGWLSSLMTGATLLPHASFEAVAILERISREKVTFMPGPPALYQSLLAGPYKNYDLSSLRIATTGGAVVPVALIGEMRRELHIGTALTAYGLSETCGTVTMCDRNDDDATIAHTSGRPLPGIEVKLVDEDGNLAPAGTPGEVLVRGYCVMQGYFEDEQATREAIDRDGWLHTGDVGVADEHGNLTITDRKKDMVIVGGFKVYPAEVERMMDGHPAIMQSAVIGIPDARLGEVPAAFVVLRGGAHATAEEIIAWCRETMANYKVPRAVTIVQELPRNAGGKVQKFLLRDTPEAANAQSSQLAKV